MDVFLPEDLEAERMAIGCAILSPAVHARKAFARLYETSFADEYHGWIWGRLSWASKKVNWDTEDQAELMRWLVKDGCRDRARYHGGRLMYDLYRFARPALWWNLPWYCSRVSGAYKRRHAILEARIHLGTLLKESQDAGLKGFQI